MEMGLEVSIAIPITPVPSFLNLFLKFCTKSFLYWYISTPYLSVTNLFSALIETAASISLLLHANSQGAPHTLPHMEARGFGILAIQYAFS